MDLPPPDLGRARLIDTGRDPEVWKRTKLKASKLEGLAFGDFKDMATAYAKHVVKERLGLDL